MMRDRDVPQRSPSSPLRPSNRGRGGGPELADAVGSSTKDHAWQQRSGLGYAPSGAGGRVPSHLAPTSDKRKSKKVEGTVVDGGAADSVAKQPAAESRIPAGPRAAQAPFMPAHQQRGQQATPATGGGSRIPRPPVFAAGASPQPDLVAMLATPVAPPLLPELHFGANARQPAWGKTPAAAGPATGKSGALPGFQAYSNPSFDSPAQRMAAAPAGPTLADAGAPAAGAASVFVNGLAEAGESADGEAQLTPGLLDAAPLSPNSDRSLQAWLRASPTSAPAASGPRLSRLGPAAPSSASPASSGGSQARGAASSVPPPTGGSTGGSGRTAGRVLPTPEAWHLLQHINEDSPAAAPQGVRGIMNAYLRTGPQALSPEPAGAGDTGLIRAPGATAVPATGLLNVAGPGGIGVMGMMNAYLRTGANMLSPEPGMEGQQQQAGPGGALHPAAAQAGVPAGPALHPYSPVSPLASTPVPAAVAAGRGPPPGAAGEAGGAGVARQPISPSSVCSNGEVGSNSSPAEPSVSPGGSSLPPSVPRLNLSGLLQQKEGGTDGTEVSFGAALAAVQQVGSPEESELPTARLFQVTDEEEDQAELAGFDHTAGGDAQHEQAQAFPPSPITFCLPGDPPPAAARQAAAAGPAGPASASPAFSFGMGHAAPAPGAQPAAAGEAQGAGGPAHGPEAPHDPHLHQRRDSAETVQQPGLYSTMLHHLRGPQYASPARFAMPRRSESPQSPQQCTPLHLISVPDGPSPPNSGGAIVTPAPGQGSLTVWMDRRGMRATLNTPARNDLRMLWAAAHDLRAYESEAAALRADNAALLGEVEAAHDALRELGVEHEAAVAAAEAGALCAEAEVTRARDAAGHMMALADQIQGMFALCENEKESLVEEVGAAQERLAHSEVAAAQTAHLSEQQRAQLHTQLEEARQAVAAAQAAADVAQERARESSAELDAIRRQLAEAQAQLEEAEAARQVAAAQPAPLADVDTEEQAVSGEQAQAQAPAQPALVLTPMAKLRTQLASVHDSLAQLHAEQRAGRLHAATPELDKLWEASRAQLAQIEELLGADPAALRAEKSQLKACLDRARTLLAKHTPATGATGGASSAGAAHDGQRADSPVPFVLFGRFSSEGDGGDGGASPASSAAAPSPDVFSSPFLAASQTTLTVDYRSLHSDLRSSWRQSDTPVSRGSSTGDASSRSPSPSSSEGSAGTAEDEVLQEGACGAHAGAAGGDTTGEREYTVVHNGMIITHVPASEVSKVRSMVHYWEAVASGTPIVEAAAAAGVSTEEAAAAEAYASAAVAAAEAALATQQAQHDQAEGQQWAVAMAEGVARELEAAQAAGQLAQCMGAELASPAQLAAEQAGPGPSPAASPVSSFTARLPAGESITPCTLPRAAAAAAADQSGASPAATPARLTPAGFVSAPPPTPAEGIDPQQAQQLNQLAVSMAAAAAGPGGVGSAASTPAGTPASALRTASRLPSTPAGTPASTRTPAGTPAGARAAAAALAVTPLALSALRARMAASGGGVQDVVRSRLARLKADLQAAQAKLATVDQGLANIAFTPTSSATGTPGSRGSTMQRSRTPLTPSTGGAGALGSPIAGGGASSLPQRSPSLGGSSGDAALIAAGGNSPFVPTGASPLAVSQPAVHQAAAFAATDASRAAPAAATPQAGVAGATAAVQCTPHATRRSVRFAEPSPASSTGRGPLLWGPPAHSAAVADWLGEAEEGGGEVGGATALAVPGSASASPVVASCLRGTKAWAGDGVSPLGTAGAVPPRRSPLGPMQSAAKPAGGGGAALRRFVLGVRDGGSSSDEDEDGELFFDASRMAQRANRAATPSPARPGAGVADGATPMAHPEPSAWRALEGDGGEEGSGSYVAGGRAEKGRLAALRASGTPAASVLSTSSFSPPQPLVLLAVRPIARARRGPGGLLRGGGRLRGEAEEREFRRRAAALNIQVSPYFRRGGDKGPQ